MAEEIKFVPKYIRRQIAKNAIKLTFTKSGKTYMFTPDVVAKQQILQFSIIQNTDQVELANFILSELKKLDEEYGIHRNYDYKILPVCCMENDITNTARNLTESIFLKIYDKWKDAPIGEYDEYSNIAENAFAADIENIIHDQNGNRLNPLDRRRVVMLKNSSSIGLQYFYTTGQYSNGYSIWRKAFNPFIWYGVQVKD